MAGHRAATSVYATLGVAAATLLVVGGILVGPSVLECSRDTGGLGACLRGKAADNGLIAPQISSEPPPQAGWMEAAANEFEPPAGLAVALEGTPADLLAQNLTAEGSEPVEIAVAPAAELATATLVPSFEAANVALIGAEGQVLAMPEAVDSGATGAVDLSRPASGELAAVAPSQPVAEIQVAPELIDPAEELTSAIKPLPSEPAPVELSAEPLPPEPSELPSSSEPGPSELPSSSEPVLVVEFNPQFPNVIVLPPPVSGDNSSFRSLQLN